MRNFALLALAAVSIAIAQPSTMTVTLSSTPSPVACTGVRYVARLTMTVVPGGSGKVFIGTSSLNTSTLAGAIAILYPNSGNASESMAFATTGDDLCAVYVAGVSGEQVLLSYYPLGTDGTTAPFGWVDANWLVTGPVSRPGIYAVPLASSSTIGGFRIQVQPGQSGKVAVGGAAYYGHETDGTLTGVAKVLWPNGGNSYEHNAWSENIEVDTPVDLHTVYLYNYVSGEAPIVAAWAQAASSPYGSTTFQGGPITLTTTPTQLTIPGGGDLAYLKIRTVPGACGKVYVGSSSMNTSTLAGVYKVIWPNCSGGHSEGFALSPIQRTTDGHPYPLDPSEIYLAGQTAGEIALWEGMTTPGTTYRETRYGTAITVGSSATQLFPTATYASYLTVSMVPGGSGKIYLGSSTMNISTLSGVLAILYPNSVGRWSETFAMDNNDQRIKADQLYAIAQVSGEQVTTMSEVYPDNSFYHTNLLQFYGGVYSPTANPTSVSFGGSCNQLRIQTVPGQSGKMVLGTSSMAAQPDSTFAGVLKILWPNTGSYYVNEGHTEILNLFSATSFQFNPAVTGEQVVALCLK